MSGFKTEEFELAFVQVYPDEQPFSQECKQFLGFLLTNTPEKVSSGISMRDSTNRDKNNEYLKTIIGYPDRDYLMQFINHANQSGLTSGEIQKPSQFPIFHVVFQMLRNREKVPPASASFAYHKKNLENYTTKAASVEPGSVHSRPRPPEAGVGGGSRRRRSSHRKRKGYRKSKRVRHTPRKQTRRHRHRRSRHRHRR